MSMPNRDTGNPYLTPAEDGSGCAAKRFRSGGGDRENGELGTRRVRSLRVYRQQIAVAGQ